MVKFRISSNCESLRHSSIEYAVDKNEKAFCSERLCSQKTEETDLKFEKFIIQMIIKFPIIEAFYPYSILTGETTVEIVIFCAPQGIECTEIKVSKALLSNLHTVIYGVKHQV